VQSFILEEKLNRPSLIDLLSSNDFEEIGFSLFSAGGVKQGAPRKSRAGTALGDEARSLGPGSSKVPGVPTIFTKGDLLNTPGVRAYALGCNCAGTMEAGVSVAFKKRWPALLEAYAQRCAERKVKLGDVFAWSEGSKGGEGGDTVFCLALQETAAKKATLPALEKSLKALVELAAAAKIDKVALPRLGAGSAALDGLRVKHILERVGAEAPVTLLVFEQFIRTKPEKV
jgi:O-acetyl-ADP-ribose deacetylase (regulator of RNase III)